MPPDTKSRILSSAYELLHREGFARVSMDAIAEAAGVTKRTLYYHYDSKDTLTAAALEHQNQFALAQIRKWGSEDADNAAEYLRGIFEELEAWASKPKWLGSGFTRLTAELSHLPGHPARRAASLHKRAVEDWLASELSSLGVQKSGELASQVMVLIEGCMSLILIHRDVSYARAAAQAAVCLVNGQET